MKELKIIELFAGVGGFRIGFERVDKNFFKTIWSNQFEPATRIQHASQIYVARFGSDNHVNEDIAKIDVENIPDHDMLVGGFPCQDYSVARTLSQSTGIEGKKGVLWWEIVRIIREKGKNSPQLLFLENVDRLIISPAKQRGRDFAMILQSLDDLGYYVEWRIINAADYGMPQRRRRTYILAYKKGSKIAKTIKNPVDWVLNNGIFAKAFPCVLNEEKSYSLFDDSLEHRLKCTGDKDLADLSDHFNKSNKTRPFQTSGIMMNGGYLTFKVDSVYNGPYTTLGDILVKDHLRENITEEFYISDNELKRWEYLKGSKKEPRTRKNGEIYYYNEGSMSFPDSLDKPSRTIITSEGGKTPSRFKHVIKDPVNGKLRRLIPIELERLDMFPDNHTIGVNDVKRAFFMGNALVCGVITKVAEELYNILKD